MISSHITTNVIASAQQMNPFYDRLLYKLSLSTNFEMSRTIETEIWQFLYIRS